MPARVSAQRLLTDQDMNNSRTAADSVKKTGVPVGIYVWHVEPRFGGIIPAEVDTASHRFQNDAFTEGVTGRYNYTGNLGAPRESRLFSDRNTTMQNNPFIFANPYDFFLTTPGEFFFTNTKSPFTNITYHECGNKQNGEDRITALFSVNAGKKLGMGFKLDYLYGRGYYAGQSTAHFNGALYASYRDERYNMHVLYTANHLKTSENGGIESDDYVTRPETFPTSYGEADMPTNLTKAWNRQNVNTFFLTHRYNVGFTRYRDDEGRVVKRSELPKNFLPVADSLKKAGVAAPSAPANDSITLTPEFVPVSSFIHTLKIDHNNRRFVSNDPHNINDGGYFNDFYLPGDSANDFTKHLSVENTLALELNEGFNRWVKSGMRLYARHRFSRYTLPDEALQNVDYTENYITLGAQLMKQQGRFFRYNVTGEVLTTGDKWGEFNIEADARFSIPVKKDSLLFKLNGFVRNEEPSFYYTHYHARNAWWDNSLSQQLTARAAATLAYKKTRLTATLQSIQNYTYFAESLTPYSESGNGAQLFHRSIGVAQSGKNIQLLGLTLEQDFKWGPLCWENELTYQLSSESDVLPLPAFNAYTNVYLLFRIAKVLRTEIGADLRYFTRYYAPTYSPLIGQYALQDGTHRIKVGNHPFVNVYANFHLKNTRFYVMASHVNYKNGSGFPFLVPHYPTNRMVLRLGISWNFFN